MNICRSLIFGLALAGLSIAAEAQNPPAQVVDKPGASGGRSTPAGALSGLTGLETDIAADDTSIDVPQIPALLGGRGTSLAFQSEMERTNYLRGGLSVGATYDDNPLLVTSDAHSNTGYSVFPNLAIEQSWPRMRWTLAYAGGLTVNQNLTNRNQGSHDLNLDTQFRLSPHVNLRVAEDFSLVTGFFDSGNGSALSAGGGPNASLITPLSTQRTNSTVVEGNYHFALNDVMGASGSFYDLHFTNVPASSLLANTQTESGSAFWLHRIFRRNWAGASYRFDRLTFDPSGGETLVHSFVLVDTLGLSHGFTFSGFLGPQYSDNRGLVPEGGGDTISQFQQWSTSGGVEAGWQDARTSCSTGFSRRIADGGGLLGAVRSQTVRGDLRRELVPGWAVRFGGSYGNNKALTGAFNGSASTIDVTSFSASVERNVGKSLGLRVGYGHDFQQESGFADPTQKLDAHRNRFFVTLSYQWAKPLGM